MVRGSPEVNMRQIYVVGPSSTGKTTLCTALAAQLRLPLGRFVHEVARTVMKSTGFSRSTVGVLDMQRAILVAQVAAEERGLEEPSEVPLLLSDRSAVDPLVYAALGFADGTLRQDELIDSEDFRRALPRYRRSLFVLLLPVEQWVVDDGVRTLESRQECVQVFRATLSKLNISWKEIGDEVLDLNERVKRVLEWDFQS